MAYVPLADSDNVTEMHHPHSFVEKYVWSQDHKVIAIQYGGLAVFTGVVGAGAVSALSFAARVSRDCNFHRS